ANSSLLESACRDYLILYGGSSNDSVAYKRCDCADPRRYRLSAARCSIAAPPASLSGGSRSGEGT
ncbi:MAG: hypothetical protein ACK5Q5_02320, partial [Planctomycetaceae bacterium]